MARRRLVLAALGAALASIGAALPSMAATGSTTWTFGTSAIVGGGFQNTVAVSPSDPSRVLLGGDVSGLHRSTDSGHSWRPSNTGLSEAWLLSIASVTWAPTAEAPDRAFAVSGNGTLGAFLVSSDGGGSWRAVLRSDRAVGDAPALPRFVLAPGTDMHPRPTGALIAVDPVSDAVYAGTSNGVFRSTDGGRNWDEQPAALDGRAVTSLVLDPLSPDTAYVAVRGGDVYAVHDLRSRTGAEPPVVPLGLPRPGAEEVVAVAEGLPVEAPEGLPASTTLYVAAGTGGVFRWSSPGGTPVWADITGPISDPLATAAPVWTSVDAVALAGGTRVFVACTLCRRNADGGYESVWTSPDGGGSWTRAVTPANVRRTINGGDLPWWLIDPANGKQGGVALDGRSYTAAQIAVVASPVAVTDVYVSGRSGVWRGRPDDAGGLTWVPAVNGLSATVARDVATSPRSDAAATVAEGDIDWSVITSTTSLDPQTAPRKHTPVKTPRDHSTYDVAFDAAGTLFAAFGDRDDTRRGGTIWSHAPPFDATPWVNAKYPRPKQPVPAPAVPLAPRVVGIAPGTISGQPALIAVDSGGLVRRKVGGYWKPASTFSPRIAGMFSGPNLKVDIYWPAGSAYVYLYDARSGLWRSTNYGATFTRIWSTVTDARFTGNLAGFSAGTVDTLFVSTADGLFRLANARTGAAPIRIGLLDAERQQSQQRERISSPGPVTVDRAGTLYVAESAAAGPGAGLYRAEDAVAGADPAFRLISDAAYSGAALFPTGLALGLDDYLYVSTFGSGVIVGCPDSAGTCPR